MNTELLCIPIGRLSIVFTTTSIVFATPSGLTLSSSNCFAIEHVLKAIKTLCFAMPGTLNKTVRSWMDPVSIVIEPKSNGFGAASIVDAGVSVLYVISGTCVVPLPIVFGALRNGFVAVSANKMTLQICIVALTICKDPI